MSFAIEHMGKNIWRGRFTGFDESICTHALTARLGGVSKIPYASMNMALHVGDDADLVWENRVRFFQQLGLNPENLVTPEQVHGENIVRVTAKDAGRGAHDYDSAISKTDALITNEAGLPLMLCFADCTPIIFLDEKNKAVGIAHGGWKGTVASIAAKTALAMQKEFGTDLNELKVGIGPAIGPCCYEVGEEVAQKFKAAFKAHADKLLIKAAADKYKLNLWEVNRFQLVDIGVNKANIEMADTCTACQHKWFYSYRADNKITGRMAAIIALNKY